MQGQWQFDAKRELVWQTLTDPAIVAQCIPGCEKMEPTGEDTYTAVLAVGVGSVKGRYNSTILLTDKQFPDRYRLIVEGKSPVGFVKGEGTITLQETQNGQTQVSIDGDVQVGGTIASVGSRLIQATATMLLNRFFEAMRQQIAARQKQGSPSPPSEGENHTVC